MAGCLVLCGDLAGPQAPFYDRALSATGRMACATCHDPGHAFGPPNSLAVQPGGNAPRRAGAFPQLTDFGYATLSVPRNAAIPANGDRRYFDLGLCGPLREDLRDRHQYCGLFRTPSLRNVALRKVFFHNGVVHRLADAVRFYAERDTRPERWYPRTPDGTIRKFNDLPDTYWGNIDQRAPFARRPGEAPSLSDADIDDLVAFLKTLTDGYRPGRTSGGAPVAPVAQQ